MQRSWEVVWKVTQRYYCPIPVWEATSPCTALGAAQEARSVPTPCCHLICLCSSHLDLFWALSFQQSASSVTLFTAQGKTEVVLHLRVVPSNLNCSPGELMTSHTAWGTTAVPGLSPGQTLPCVPRPTSAPALESPSLPLSVFITPQTQSLSSPKPHFPPGWQRTLTALSQSYLHGPNTDAGVQGLPCILATLLPACV